MYAFVMGFTLHGTAHWNTVLSVWKLEGKVGKYALYNWPDVVIPPYDVRKYVIRMGIWGGTVQRAHVTVSGFEGLRPGTFESFQ